MNAATQIVDGIMDSNFYNDIKLSMIVGKPKQGLKTKTFYNSTESIKLC